MRIKSSLVKAAVTFTLFMGSMGSAQADVNSGNYELLVNAGSCYSWQDQSLCGPAMQVRLPALPWSFRTASEDLANGVATLADSNGVLVGTYRSVPDSGGLTFHDPDYRGPKIYWRAPTNLSHGSYSLNVTLSAAGHWDCSIYYSSGCIWAEPINISKNYKFTWGSAQQIVSPEVEVQSQAPVAPSLTLSKGSKTSGLSLASIAGIVVPAKSKVTFTVAKSSKKQCSKSGSKLKAKKIGSCTIKITIQEPKPKGGKKPKPVKQSVTYSIQ